MSLKTTLFRMYQRKIDFLPLTLAVCIFLFSYTHNAVSAEYWVDDTGSDETGNGSLGNPWGTIQGAIDKANVDDTIKVNDGEYNENVKVNKRLNIESVNGASVTKVIGEANKHTFMVTVSGVTINGFTVTGAIGSTTHPNPYNGFISLISPLPLSLPPITVSSAGIYLANSASDCAITNNICSGNYCGIAINSMTVIDPAYDVWVPFPENNLVSDNVCNNNTYGIFIFGADNNEIVKNTVTDNNRGICVEGSLLTLGKMLGLDFLAFLDSLIIPESNYISENIITEYTYGMYLFTSKKNNISNNQCSIGNYGFFLRYSSTDNIEMNICHSGNYGMFISDSDGVTLTGNECHSSNYGISMLNTKNSVLSGNNCHNNNHGINLSGSTGNKLISNECSTNISSSGTNINNSGISLIGSNENQILGNICNENQPNGVCLIGSNNNILSGNICEFNDYGIHLISSDNNMLIPFEDEDTTSSFQGNTSSNNNANGISLTYSSNNTLWGNTSTNNKKHGMDLNGLSEPADEDVANINIDEDDIVDSFFQGIGAIFPDISDEIIDGLNYIFGNSLRTLFEDTVDSNIIPDNPRDNILYYNIFNQNEHGIHINNASSNRFFLNNFQGSKTTHVFSTASTNIWNTTYKTKYEHKSKEFVGFLGNYYTGHSLSDENGDGITEMPFDLPPDEPDDLFALAFPFQDFIVDLNNIDTDGDGVLDDDDGCPTDINKTEAGICGCLESDEVDSDEDNVPDCIDKCPTDPNKDFEVGICDCGVSETDTDDDGAPDCVDLCPENPFLEKPGSNGCEQFASEDPNSVTKEVINNEESGGNGGGGCFISAARLN